jgi:hypothetical protein
VQRRSCRPRRASPQGRSHRLQRFDFAHFLGAVLGIVKRIERLVQRVGHFRGQFLVRADDIILEVPLRRDRLRLHPSNAWFACDRSVTLPTLDRTTNSDPTVTTASAAIAIAIAPNVMPTLRFIRHPVEAMLKASARSPAKARSLLKRSVTLAKFIRIGSRSGKP